MITYFENVNLVFVGVKVARVNPLLIGRFLYLKHAHFDGVEGFIRQLFPSLLNRDGKWVRY